MGAEQPLCGEKRERENYNERRNGKPQNCSRAAIFERAREKSGPAPAPVGLAARLRENLWDIDRKFVRRRVHAGVIAGAAVVAQVRQIKHIALLKIAARLDCAKHGAVAFAVAAGVADDELARG